MHPSSIANVHPPDAPIVSGGNGLIGDFGWTSDVAPSSTTVFLGDVTFHVDTTDPTNLWLGFFRTEGSFATDESGKFITPNFSHFIVNPVPEAGAAS